MPRSPTMTICASPNLSRTTVTICGERGRVAGVAGEHPDRDRAAGRVGEQPVLDLQLAFLAVPGVAAGGQRAAPALQPRAGQVEQRHPRRVRLRAQVAAGQPGLDRVLPVAPASPSPRRCHRWTASATPRSAPRVVSAHQVKVDSLEPGLTTREMIRARARSRCAARRAEQRGQAQLAGHGVHGGDVPVRQRPGDGDRLAGGDQLLALQPGVDQVDDVVRAARTGWPRSRS